MIFAKTVYYTSVTVMNTKDGVENTVMKRIITNLKLDVDY